MAKKVSTAFSHEHEVGTKWKVQRQAQLGRAEEARESVERIRTEFPAFSVENYVRDSPMTSPKALAPIREGATKAGLLPVATQ